MGTSSKYSELFEIAPLLLNSGSYRLFEIAPLLANSGL
jgi:hypothetical protein